MKSREYSIEESDALIDRFLELRPTGLLPKFLPYDCIGGNQLRWANTNVYFWLTYKTLERKAFYSRLVLEGSDRLFKVSITYDFNHKCYTLLFEDNDYTSDEALMLLVMSMT